jgi:hypothetical protein
MARVWLMAEGGSWTDKGTMGATVVAAVIAGIALVWSIRAARDAGRQAEAAKKSAGAAAEQVAVARDQLDQDRASFETEIRPMIVDAPFRRSTRESLPEDADTNVWWDIPLSTEGVKGAGTAGAVAESRNVGGGVAFVQAVRIDTGAIYKATLDRKVIPAGETARFQYVIPHLKFAEVNHFRRAVRDGTIYIAVLYTDLPGRQRLLTKLPVADEKALRLTPLRDNRQQLKVSKVEVYQCADDWTPAEHPFATTDWPQE